MNLYECTHVEYIIVLLYISRILEVSCGLELCYAQTWASKQVLYERLTHQLLEKPELRDMDISAMLKVVPSGND